MLASIALFLFFLVTECTSSRIYFSRCGTGGFSCTAINGKYKIVYQCPQTEKDATFYIWQFRAPSNIESLVLTNCTTLRMSFQCTGENKPITDLSVANVTNLYVIPASTFTHIPVNVSFVNIKNLEYIPANTFSQIKRRMPISGCFNPSRDFQNLNFYKVNIGTIAPKAFSDLKGFGDFKWTEVNVQRLQHLAIEIEFSQLNNFTLVTSNLEICEPLAFKITAAQAYFLQNKFIDINSGAINGTIGTFIFINNGVNNIQPYGISILSENVHISDNRFEYLRNGALEKISPGLLQNSQRNFGTLRFFYEFSFNSVNLMDAGSLNPDMQAYDNVATELKFHHNSLFCSCENLGWLFSSAGYGHNTLVAQEFYGAITEEEYKNRCSYTSCELPLKSAKLLIEGDRCLRNKTAESLCKVENEVKPTTQTTHTTRKTVPSTSHKSNMSICIIVIHLLAIAIINL